MGPGSDRGMDHMVWNTNLDGVRGSAHQAQPAKPCNSLATKPVALETRNAEV